MFLCWSVVYIAVEKHHADKVDRGCTQRNPDWSLEQCDNRRKTASLVAIILVTIGVFLGIYFTLVLSRWVTSIEWAEHLEEDRKLADWRAGKAENPHIKSHFQVEGCATDEAV
ncbi:hypothetical protein EDD11_009408 [Mortierella claussenii]|nr:hypothetical protein EDD11_009408 [Mortierella claussenii]